MTSWGVGYFFLRKILLKDRVGSRCFRQLSRSISSTFSPDFFAKPWRSQYSSTFVDNGILKTAHKYGKLELTYWMNLAAQFEVECWCNWKPNIFLPNAARRQLFACRKNKLINSTLGVNNFFFFSSY